MGSFTYYVISRGGGGGGGPGGLKLIGHLTILLYTIKRDDILHLLPFY